MVKIIGILVFVLIYYNCEIHAEISNYQNGKVATRTKKPIARNATFRQRPMLTTGFPEPVGGTLINHLINVFEALLNHIEQRAVQSHRAKTIRTDEELSQNEKKESEISKPKKKKKHHTHSRKRMNYIMEEINKKPQMDKKDSKKNGKIEKKHTDKKNKHKNHKENDDQELTYDAVDKPKKKHSKESKQVAKSKNYMRIAKSSKYIKVKPGTITKKLHTSTLTMKPHPKPVRAGVDAREKYEHKFSLSTQKNKKGFIRHRQLSGDEEGGEGGEGGEGEGGGGGDGDGGGDGGEYGGGDGGGDGSGGGGEGGGGNEEVNPGGHSDGGGGGHQDDHGVSGDHPKHVYETHENKNYPSHLSPYAIVEQMEALMTMLREEFPNVNATVTKFARTVEYNDLVLITVTDIKESERYSRAKDSKYIDDAPEKKIIFIVHGLTVMGMKSMTSLVQMSQLKLLFSYYFKYLDKFNFYIMPLANPDGYSASRSFGHPIWNKNMSPQSECPGVFVDRNFDVAWNASKEISSCSQIYPGPTPFSEVESQAVRDVFHYYSHKILAYIHVHSGTYDEKVFKGDAILYPRGYTESQSDDDKYIDLKGEIDEAMKNASFRVISVSVDTLANWYGIISGSSVDYAASVFGIPYALEFVMQIYDPESLNNNALTQIWSRLIDTTLTNMWKSLNHGSEERRHH